MCSRYSTFIIQHAMKWLSSGALSASTACRADIKHCSKLKQCCRDLQPTINVHATGGGGGGACWVLVTKINPPHTHTHSQNKNKKKHAPFRSPFLCCRVLNYLCSRTYCIIHYMDTNYSCIKHKITCNLTHTYIFKHLYNS